MSYKNSDWQIIENKLNTFNVFSDVKVIFNNFFLVLALLRRDFLAVFKQTILGPTWFILQPIATTVVFTVIFGQVAKISTDGIPPFLFYLSGVVMWNYFISNTGRSSNLLGDNFSLLSKIVFPVIILPFNSIIISILRFFLQYILFLIFLIFFYIKGVSFQFSYFSFISDIYSLVILSILSSGLGMFLCSISTKYKDLVYVNSFFLGLLIYATPVVYPLSSASGAISTILSLNPITFHIELFRYMHLGQGTVNIFSGVWSTAISLILFIVGYYFFKRRAMTFIDTI